MTIDFLWSGLCGGVPAPIIVPPDSPDLKGDLELWRSEGEKLTYFLTLHGLDYTPTSVISHSHGLQLVAFAAAACPTDLLFSTVISISGPVREDMEPIRIRARAHIGCWVQVYDPVSDLTIREGEAFDGHVGWNYALPEADQNIRSDGSGHSGVLTDLTWWDRLKLWDLLDGGA